MTANNKGKAPAFQFYAADWLADQSVSMMTLEEEGAYIRAMCYCWREGSIPADDDKLSRLLKGASISVLDTVRNCFEISSVPSRLIHTRLETEREKQKEFAESQRARANQRWGRSDGMGHADGSSEVRLGNADSLPMECRNDAGALPERGMPDSCSSSTSSSSLLGSQIDGMVDKDETRMETEKKSSSDSIGEITPEQRLASLMLSKVLRHNPDEISDQVYARALKEAKTVLLSREFDYVRSVLKYARNDSWWFEQLKKAKFPMAYFAKSFDSIAEQMESAAPPSVAPTAKHVEASAKELKGRDTTTNPFARFCQNVDSEKEK